MGLIHPTDLGAWAAWQQSRHRLRQIRTVLRPPAVDSVLRLTTCSSSEPRVLIALDSRSPSHSHALEAVTRWLAPEHLAVLAPVDTPDLFGVASTRSTAVTSARDLADLLPETSRVLAAGNFLPAGGQAFDFATLRSIPYFVVQHGLLTPFAPPLPPRAHLLAWSEQDADFWGSGRHDITATVVGSQMLWAAAQDAGGAALTTEGVPTFLGQLHGAELPRREVERVSRRFCLGAGAVYRPHPGEVDLTSRAIHAVWRRIGVRFSDVSAAVGGPLEGPVVSIFSTGVLEAASRGVPAWVHHPTPPAWLKDLWRRYALSPWGSHPTPPFDNTDKEPAKAIVEHLDAQEGLSA